MNAQNTPTMRMRTPLRIVVCIMAAVAMTTAGFADTWTQRTDLSGQGRIEAVAFTINGKGYMGTGYNGAPLGDFFEFDPATNAWSQKADFGGGPRTRATGFSIGSKGYIGTGLTGVNTNHDDLWEYDPAQNTWASKTAFPGGVRQMATGFSIGDKGYIGFGTVFTTYPTDFYSYDPTTDSWTEIAGASYFGLGRTGTTAFTANGIAYVGGGAYSGSLIDQFHAYDPSTDTWSSVASFPPGGRVSMVSFSIGGKGYVGAGGGENGIVADMWQYDPATNTWVQKEDVPGPPRWSAFSFGIGDKGYVGSGSPDYATYLTDFHEYGDYDCLGVAGGNTHPGSACDDGDASTTNDVYQADCVCAGTSVQTGGWTQRADLGGGGRAQAFTFSVSGKGYLGGGYFDTFTSNSAADVWAYDPTTDSWAQVADFGGGARAAAVGFEIAGIGYAGMGEDGNTYTNDLWAYDPMNNTWTAKAPLPAPGRRKPFAFAVGGRGYVGTGLFDDNVTMANDLWAYDPDMDSWTAKASLPGSGRWAAASFSIGGIGFVCGGSDDQYVDLADFYGYDPLSDTWTTLADMPGPTRRLAAGFSIGQAGYVACGAGAERYDDCYEYRPGTNSWVQITSPGPTPRSSTQAFTIGDKAYLCGGYITLNDTLLASADVRMYTRDTELDCNGVLGGPSVPGTPCDDGNPGTTGEVFDANCICTGATAIMTLSAPGSGFAVWPNPNNGEHLRIRLTSTDRATRKATVVIYDATGRRTFGTTLPMVIGTLDSELDLGHIGNGLYNVRVTLGSETHESRVLVVN